MRTFNLKQRESEDIIWGLSIDDLQSMAASGELNRNDKIREDGHRTWHFVSKIKGLEVVESTSSGD